MSLKRLLLIFILLLVACRVPAESSNVPTPKSQPISTERVDSTAVSTATAEPATAVPTAEPTSDPLQTDETIHEVWRLASSQLLP